MCGGTTSVCATFSRVRGLSPRVRGNPTNVPVHINVLRSIPACAGEPRLRFPELPTREVYPRVCGGTGCKGEVRAAQNGLSPRVRGNRDRAEARRASRGLSPRVRGNRLRPAIDTRDRGSIPACAGEPRTARRNGCCPRVYPRVCGGTISVADAMADAMGLSPRVRGNRDCDDSRRLRPGSIPACAGEPRSATMTIDSETVYPRVCGGTLPPQHGVSSAPGLSPRVRGNLARSTH